MTTQLKQLLLEIQETAEMMPVGGIGADGPTIDELNQAAKEGQPYGGDANYDTAQRIWRLAETALTNL